MKKTCTLERDINRCPHLDPTTEECHMPEEKCSFMKQNMAQVVPIEEKKEKWYEIYMH